MRAADECVFTVVSTKINRRQAHVDCPLIAGFSIYSGLMAIRFVMPAGCLSQEFKSDC